jgi:outer membrane protein TolC
MSRSIPSKGGRMTSWRLALRSRLLITLLFVGSSMSLAAAPVPFRKVIEMAVKHSSTMAIAGADQRKAYETYAEARSMYTPQITLGSGLGYSYGVPLSIEGSAPSIFNVTSQQFLFNMAQKDYIRASHQDWESAKFDIADKRDQVILDAASAYIELDSLTARLNALQDEQKAAERAEFISKSRLQEGVDSSLDLKKVQLTSARVRLRMAESTGAADVLRERLSSLTGLPASTIETDHDSIPKPPEVPQDDKLSDDAVNNNPVVRFAEERAKSAELRARAEQRQWYPAVDLASQYALLSRFNNYDEFYRKFSRNNFSFGLNIRFPFLNIPQRHRAEQAQADLVKARKEAEAAKAQVSENSIKVQRSLRQLSAANDVARLEYEVAQAGVDTTQVRVQNGEANSRDAEQARVDASDRLVSYLESTVELTKAQLQFMRSTGSITKWALGTDAPEIEAQKR